MLDFILCYLGIGVFLMAIFEYLIDKNKELLESLGEDVDVTIPDRIFTIVFWPFAIIYILFS